MSPAPRKKKAGKRPGARKTTARKTTGRKTTGRKTAGRKAGGGRRSAGDKRSRAEKPAKVGGKRMPARSSSARDAKKDIETIRLNKYLADQGVASRRASDELIVSGKVLVDGAPVTELGTRVDPHTQTVEIDGVILRPEGLERRYYLLHKPGGVVCTNEVRETRPRAVDLINDPRKGRIFTVGRLDEESTGLLILTNDGEFAQRIAHPRYGVTKTYRVRVQGRMSDNAVQKVRDGVHLSDGRTEGARILVQRRTTHSTTLLVTIREGKNREVRRVFARVGYNVSSLARTDIGPLSVRGLKAGSWRALSRAEVEALLADSSEERGRQPLHELGRWREDGEEAPAAPRGRKQATPGKSAGRAPSRATGRKKATKKAAKKTAKKTAKKATKKTAKKTVKKTARKGAKPTAASSKAPARKPAAKKAGSKNIPRIIRGGRSS